MVISLEGKVGRVCVVNSLRRRSGKTPPSHHFPVSNYVRLTLTQLHPLLTSPSHRLNISNYPRLRLPRYYSLSTLFRPHHFQSQYISDSRSHDRTFSESYSLTDSPFFSLKLSPTHTLLSSPSSDLKLSPTHCFTVSDYASLTLTRPHPLPTSLSHRITIFQSQTIRDSHSPDLSLS